MLVKGSSLPANLKAEVLAIYVYRWTTGNTQLRRAYKCPLCNLESINPDSIACRQYHPTIPLVSDEQWLADHAFHVTKRGTLDKSRKYAEPACLADLEKPAWDMAEASLTPEQ